MLSQRLLKSRLRTLVARGAALSAQMTAVVSLAQRSRVDVSTLLGPVALLDDLYARGMMTGISWIMRDASFPMFPLDLQRVVLGQASLWSSLWGCASTLPFRTSVPAVTTLRTSDPATAGVAVGVQVEQLTNAATLAGILMTNFWTTSSDSYVALGRLGAYDFALTPPSEDPTSYWEFALLNMAPVVPDVAAMLSALTRVQPPTFTQRLTQQQSAMRVTSGMTLPQIASQVLGDASQWQILAQLNGLRAPYISDDPTTQLGAARGNRVLGHLAPAGSTTLQLTDVSGLLVDQRLGIRLGDAWQSVTVTAIDTTTRVVTVRPAVEFAVTLAAVITVYNPTYNVVGRVLQPGDYLAVPVGTSGNGVSYILAQRQAATDDAKLYGVDVGTTAEGNLALAEGDLAMVSGVPNLRQALAHRFQTPRGSLPYHPLYGSDLHQFLGTKLVPYLSFLGAVDARQTLLRDPRAVAVREVTVSVNGDRMNVEATVETSQQEQFPLQVQVGG